MLSFSSLRSHPKVTLPSVDNGWLINSSIVKDPPKSIHTRRIDKVGSTQMYTDMIEDNGSRICGEIMKFPRGVNPAAEYTEPIPNTNSGNGHGYGYNAGATSTIRDNSGNPPTLRSDPGYKFRSQYGRGSGGYLARRIMMYGGAFRPPILTQEQLLPLSRQPRVRTSCVTHPEKIDYSVSSGCSNIDISRNIKEYVIQPNCEGTVKRVIENSGQENQDIKNFIQDKLLTENVNAGIRPMDIRLQENFKCKAVTDIKPTTAYAYTPKCTEKFTRDTMLYAFQKPTPYINEHLLHSNVIPNVKFNESNKIYPLNQSNSFVRDDLICSNVMPNPTYNENDNIYPMSDINPFVHDELLNTNDVIPNIQYMEHDSVNVDNANTTKYILEYPRAVTDVVCAPTKSRTMGANEIEAKFYLTDNNCNPKNVLAQPTWNKNVLTENQNIVNFVKDDVLNSYDVVSGPALDTIYAYNLVDNNNVNTHQYVHSDILQSDDVHAGIYGSNKITKKIDEMSDFSCIKTQENNLHVDAVTSKVSIDKNVYMHKKDECGKRKVIKQYTKDAYKTNFNVDDPNLQKRTVHLRPTIDMSEYSVSNNGYRPQRADRVAPVVVQSQLNDGELRNRIKLIKSQRI